MRAPAPPELPAELRPLWEAYTRHIRSYGAPWAEARLAALLRELSRGWLVPVRLPDTGDPRFLALVDRSSGRLRVHAAQSAPAGRAGLTELVDRLERGPTGPVAAVSDLFEGADEEQQRSVLAPRGFARRALVSVELPEGAPLPERTSRPGLRPIRPTDRRAFVQSYPRVYVEPQGDYWITPAPDTRVEAERFFDQFLDGPTRWNDKLVPDASFAAFDGERLVGSVLAGRTREGRWHLFGLSVEPDRRRQGLGRSLLAESLRGLRANGAGVVSLSVERGTPADHLYASVGFRPAPPPADRLPGYWVRP